MACSHLCIPLVIHQGHLERPPPPGMSMTLVTATMPPSYSYVCIYSTAVAEGSIWLYLPLFIMQEASAFPPLLLSWTTWNLPCKATLGRRRPSLPTVYRSCSWMKTALLDSYPNVWAGSWEGDQDVGSLPASSKPFITPKTLSSFFSTSALLTWSFTLIPLAAVNL